MIQRHSGRKGRNKTDVIKNRKEFPRLLLDVIKQSDILLEILDARFIDDTRNKEIEELIKKQGKRIIYVLNKSDLIDRKEIKKQLEMKNLYPYEIISCILKKGSRDLRDRIKQESRKINQNKVYIGVIGYPNTGKSSIINFLVSKKSARSSTQSGYTKGIQKIKLTENLVLIDSPGVIPEKEYLSKLPNVLGKHTKINVTTYNKVKDPEMQVFYLIKNYLDEIQDFYKIDSKGDFERFLEILGRNKNMLKKGNEIDTERAARLVLKDWQEGKIKI